jgi:hypothetical protein
MTAHDPSSMPWVPASDLFQKPFQTEALMAAVERVYLEQGR